MNVPRICLCALVAASTAAAADAGSPYVLDIDRSAYTLDLPRPAASAGAGSSSSIATQAPPPAVWNGQAEIAQIERREREYQHRISELVRERDSWKLYASRLEADLRLRSGAISTLPPPSTR